MNLVKKQSIKPTEPIPWRTFSIFISSTFADMQAERDHLKDFVFPRVKEELQKQRIKLEVVDLRWGVDTASIKHEDEREATVLKVCLDEIKRCRPFFIGLLGDRYGWVPPEERMKNAVVGETLLLPNKGKSVTALEIEFGVLASKEQLNRSVFYFRAPFDYSQFSPEKKAIFTDEHNPALTDEEKKARISALAKLKADIKTHFEKQGLKNESLAEKVKSYPASWDKTKEKVSGLEAWGEVVFKDIIRECENHAEDTWDKVPKNWQEEELALLDAFIEGHTHITKIETPDGAEEIPTFCGREELLKDIKRHLLEKDKENWGLVLTGESGSGKSAVFSMAYKQLQKEDCFVLTHSAGLSPRSKNILDLLQIWNTQLRESLGIKEEQPELKERPENIALSPEGIKQEAPKLKIEKIQDKFRELMFTVAEKTQVVLLVDALDRFEPTERAQFMTWLPTVMPGNIRMLCTAITHTEEKAVQYHNGLFVKNLDYFTKQEAKEMLDTLCRQQHKTLPEKVTLTILGKMRTDGQPAISSPLWLSMAVNMMMAIDHDDFEKISQLEGRGDQQIERYIADMAIAFDPSPGSLFLSLVEKAGQVFGEKLTKAVFNYIACSRIGLREKDLEKILSVEKTELDLLQFASLRRWFKAHLALQGEDLQWNLVHNILRLSLLEESEEDKTKILHQVIAKHLTTLKNDPLKTTEAMYHLLQAGDTDKTLEYYISDLREQEIDGATKALTEEIVEGDNGIEKATNLIEAAKNSGENLWELASRYLHELDISLEEFGKPKERYEILDVLKIHLDRTSNELKVNHEDNYAVIFERLGGIQKLMGNMEEALKYFELFNKLEKELYKANPQNETMKYNLALSYSKIGDIQKLTGRLEEALKYFEESVRILNELRETNSRNVFLIPGLAMSYERLGELYQAMGHMEDALKYFEIRASLGKELYEADPRNDSSKEGVAISFQHLGIIHQEMGNKEEALKCFKNYNQLVKELYEANPHNESLKTGFAISCSRFGDIQRSMGRQEEALKFFDKEVRLFKELYEANPHNEFLKTGYAISYSRLGEINKSSGNLTEALKYLDEGMRLNKELYEANPHNESLKNGLAKFYGRLGELHQTMGNQEETFRYFGYYNQIEKELYEANPDNVGLLEELGMSYYKLAFFYKNINDHENGQKKFTKWKKIISFLTKNLPEVSRYAEWDKLEYSETEYSNQPNLQDKQKTTHSLEQTKEYINRNKLHVALEMLDDFEVENSLIKNAKGVCFLKLEMFSKALKYFLDITREGTFGWKETAKIEYKRNLLVTFLLLKKMDAYNSAIKDLDISEMMDEEVQKIIKTYKDWEESIKLELAKVSFFKRARLKKELMEKPISFNFPIGELDF